jgi:hypothetical protein
MLFGDLEVQRPDLLVFGEFVTLFTVYCMLETDDILRCESYLHKYLLVSIPEFIAFLYDIVCFFIFDRKKTGIVKTEDIQNFIKMLHDDAMPSNAEVGMQAMDSMSNGDGTFTFEKLKSLNRQFPHLLYPAFR